MTLNFRTWAHRKITNCFIRVHLPLYCFYITDESLDIKTETIEFMRRERDSFDRCGGGFDFNMFPGWSVQLV